MIYHCIACHRVCVSQPLMFKKLSNGGPEIVKEYIKRHAQLQPLISPRYLGVRNIVELFAFTFTWCF